MCLLQSESSFLTSLFSEHLAAAEVLGVNHFIIVQNKLDLVQRVRADQHREEIERFVRGSRAEKAPVIPISAQLGINMDILCDQLANIPKPTRDLTKPPLMVIIRSFDVNLPGMEDFTKLVGGVVGGTLLQGVLKVSLTHEANHISDSIKDSKLTSRISLGWPTSRDSPWSSRRRKTERWHKED